MFRDFRNRWRRNFLGGIRRTPLLSGSYSEKLRRLFGSSIVSYLPLWEPAGATVAADISGRGYNGAPTAVTFGAAGIGDGSTAASFDGSTSFIDWYSAGLASAFNASEGTLMIWAKVSAAGVWTDTTVRVLGLLSSDGVSQNYIRIIKNSINNQLVFTYRAGNVNKAVTKSSVTTTGWMALGLTWSVSADEVKAYFGGVQEGTTQTGLGTWAGALQSTAALIGALSAVPANVWSGPLAHALLLNRAATDAEMLAAGTVSG